MTLPLDKRWVRCSPNAFSLQISPSYLIVAAFIFSPCRHGSAIYTLGRKAKKHIYQNVEMNTLTLAPAIQRVSLEYSCAGSFSPACVLLGRWSPASSIWSHSHSAAIEILIKGCHRPNTSKGRPLSPGWEKAKVSLSVCVCLCICPPLPFKTLEKNILYHTPFAQHQTGWRFYLKLPCVRNVLCSHTVRQRWWED